MKIGVRSAALATAVLGVSWLPAQTVLAGATVFGNGLAQVCARAARDVSKNQIPAAQSVQACDLALGEEDLTLHDRAGTFINRGVVRLSHRAFKDAKQDFDAAAELMPTLGEAYTDRGAALIGLRDYAHGIADIDRGLGLNPDEPEKAYFNRALADEALDDMKSAYFDYLQASQLKPDWVQPRTELTRFTVNRQ